MLSLCGSCLVCRLPAQLLGLHLHLGLHTAGGSLGYREDYLKLGVAETASKEEIKSAYFARAKKLHPDSYGDKSKETEREFLELNEAYKRLMYEAKHGLDSFDKTDPRNDPRTREYWDVRRRTQTQEQINFEEALNSRNRDKEKKIIRTALVGKTTLYTIASTSTIDFYMDENILFQRLVLGYFSGPYFLHCSWGMTQRTTTGPDVRVITA